MRVMSSAPTAQESAAAAEELNAQAMALHDISECLTALIGGTRGQAPAQKGRDPLPMAGGP